MSLGISMSLLWKVAKALQEDRTLEIQSINVEANKKT